MIDRSLLTHLHIRHRRGRRRLCDAFSSHTARGAAAWACSLSNRGGFIMASSTTSNIGILLLQHARAILQTRAGASHRRSSTHVCSLSCSSSKRGSQRSRSDSRRRLAEPCEPPARFKHFLGASKMRWSGDSHRSTALHR